MRRAYLFPVLALGLALSGCGGRSISDSGFHRSYHYQGEIHDLHLLAEPGARIEDRNVPDFLAAPGDRILLLQSGADAPDSIFYNALAEDFEAIPISGIPLGATSPRDDRALGLNYNSLLRNAASAANARYVVIYWGSLDASKTTHAQATVSWIPLIGSLIPDQTQELRIRLKAIIMEPTSGCWRMIIPDPASDRRLSSPLRRGESDQEQVRILKEKASQSLRDHVRQALGLPALPTPSEEAVTAQVPITKVP